METDKEIWDFRFRIMKSILCTKYEMSNYSFCAQNKTLEIDSE